MPTCSNSQAASVCADSSTPTGKPPRCADNSVATCAGGAKPEKCTDGSSPSQITKVDRTTVDGKTGLATKTESTT